MTYASAVLAQQLEVFQHAVNWKTTLAKLITPHLGSLVLEVGAGLGGTTSFLMNQTVGKWLCLEPDPEIHSVLRQRLKTGELPACCEAFLGTVKDIAPETAFDTILYIDVLEHIPDDKGELERAARLLRQDGKLVIMSPTHQFLYSPFDEAIGHIRRYGMEDFRSILPPALETQQLHYLDSAGLMASLANRFLLRQSQPTVSQIKFWDSCLIPLSRIIDPLLGYRAGKSLFYVGRRTN